MFSRKLFCYKNYIICLAVFIVSSCATLPVAGPHPDDVRRNAKYRNIKTSEAISKSNKTSKTTKKKVDKALRNSTHFDKDASLSEQNATLVDNNKNLDDVSNKVVASNLDETPKASSASPKNQVDAPLELNDYALIDVDANVVNKVVVDQSRSSVSWPLNSEFSNQAIRINAGDSIGMTIYEAQSGGVFLPIEGGVRPGNFVNIPSQIVDDTGIINVPYAGKIQVIGKTTVEVATIVTRRLQKVAIEPQVVVNFSNRAGSEVSVLGAVGQSTRYSLNFNGERILDAISRAQGPSARIFETTVTLLRGDKQYTIPMTDLVDNSDYNLFLRPNDTIYLEFNPEIFTLLGSANFQGRYLFNQREVFLAEAIGRAGGLNDNRSDPADVYVYRREKSEFVKSLNVDMPEQNLPEFTSVLYKFDLRDPFGYFLTQRFPVDDGDVVYVGNAETTELIKLLNVVNPASVTTINTRAADNSL